MQVEVHSTLAAKMTTIIFEDSQSRRGNDGNDVKVTFTIESILSKFPNFAPSYLLASIDDENPHAAKKLYLKEKSMKNLMLELQSIDVKTNANDLAEKNKVLIKKKPYGGRFYSFLSLKTIKVESGEKHKIMMEHKIALMSSINDSLEKNDLSNTSSFSLINGTWLISKASHTKKVQDQARSILRLRIQPL